MNPPLGIVKNLETADSVAAAMDENGTALSVDTVTDAAATALPRSHTCFNQLVLPPYATYEILCEKINYALENAGDGFFIA